MKNLLKLILIAIFVVLTACGNQQSSKTSPIKLPSQGGKRSARSTIKVPYVERGNVKIIPVKLNDVSMVGDYTAYQDMIFDTGASGVHISLHELQTLHKNGQFSEADCIGTSLSQIADGSVVENGLIVLRKVALSEDVVLTDLEASVALNQEAPLLLGNNVLDEFSSIEIDNENKTINFKKR